MCVKSYSNGKKSTVLCNHENTVCSLFFISVNLCLISFRIDELSSFIQSYLNYSMVCYFL